MSSSPPRVTPLGDRALLVTVGDRIADSTRRRVQAAVARLVAMPHPAVTDVVPAFATVAVHYDPARVAHGGVPPHEAMTRWIAARLASLPDASHAGDALDTPDVRLVEIPVRYGGADGPDLELVAAARGLSPAEVVARHAAAEYVVHFVGFMPGFAYLGGLDPALATPRRDVPRQQVPAGSVGIGGAQTGVYPVASPGGWQLIGRTPLALFDPAREPASLLRTGDHVRFVAADGGRA